jgi:hypothetical protein
MRTTRGAGAGGRTELRASSVVDCAAAEEVRAIAARNADAV